MTDEELKLCNLCGSRLFDGGVDWYCSNRNCDGPACEEPVTNIMTDRTNYCTGCKERQDRIEALTAALVEIRTCTTEHGGAAKALRIIEEALEKQP